MNNYYYTALVVFSLLLANLAHSAPSELALAKKNHEENCTRGFPEAVLNPTKVQKHQFKTLASQGSIFGKETATLTDGQHITIQDQGCEWYSWEISLILNAPLLEANKKFCDKCLVQQLKQYSSLFKTDNKPFYTESLKPLIKTVQQRHKLKVDHEYLVNSIYDMRHTTTLVALKKINPKQYKVELLFSDGPLYNFSISFMLRKLGIVV